MTGPPREAPKALGTILDLAKLEFDTQFKLAERYDAKVRGTLALATLVFGIAQAALTRGVLAGASDQEKAIVVSLAILSFAALVVALGCAAWALLPSQTYQIRGDWLTKQLANPQHLSDTEWQFDLVNELTLIVEKRQEDNKGRSLRMRICQGASIVSLLLVGFQLLAQIIVLA